jgi:uncharacterized protein
MLGAISRLDRPFALFGGEPLLLPVERLETLFRLGLSRFGQNAIQTNGTLIDERHIDLFRRFEVVVGLSVDGPDALNDARWAGSLARTRQLTGRTIAAIDRLVEAGMPPRVLVQLTRANAVPPRLERLCSWLSELDEKGIPGGRIHLLEMDDTPARGAYGMTVEENVRALRRIADLSDRFTNLELDLLNDQENLLLMDDDDVSCVFKGCDPLRTEAVLSIDGRGTLERCGLTDREGVAFEHADVAGFERYLALAQTPQEYGGCQECRFLSVCKGQCPGTGIGGDWRNRSENCESWREIFTLAETRLTGRGLTPISLHPRRKRVEGALLEAWSRGQNPSLQELAPLVRPGPGEAEAIR